MGKLKPSSPYCCSRESFHDQGDKTVDLSLTPAAARVGFHGRPSTQRNRHFVLMDASASSQLVTSRLTSCISEPRLSRLFCQPRRARQRGEGAVRRRRVPVCANDAIAGPLLVPSKADLELVGFAATKKLHWHVRNGLKGRVVFASRALLPSSLQVLPRKKTETTMRSHTVKNTHKHTRNIL